MPAKRIILMYISEISGHHSATLAIENALRSLDPATEILNINAFSYTNPISEKIINKVYMGVIKKTPAVWEYLYDNPAVEKRLRKIKEAINKINYSKLKDLFDRFQPDAVVCTQAYPCGMVADFKKTSGSNISLLAVLTDYIPHAYWIYDSVDYYIVPSSEVKTLLIKKGVAPDKINTFGIPFDPKFNVHVNKEEVLRRLHLDPKIPIVLIMGGGHGLGPIKTVIKSLEKSSQELQLIVVAGINKKLYRSLKRMKKKSKKKLLVFSFVDNINELMEIAKVIITKPGGITIAEALSKKLPMIIVKPIPGQEANNAMYLAKKRAAIKLDDPKFTHAVVEELLGNPHKLETFRSAIAQIKKPYASMDIAKLLLEL